MAKLDRRGRKSLALISAFALALAGFTASPANATSSLVLTFESDDDYASNVDFGGNASSIVADAPAGFSGTNALKIVEGDQCWAGTTITRSEDWQLITADNKSVTAKVNTAQVGASIHLKLEDTNNGDHNIEVNATETSVSGWHTYTFDFSSPSGAAFDAGYSYNTASLFVGFSCGSGLVVAAGTEWFVDDVTFPALSLLPVPRENTSTLLTFEPSDELGALAAGNAALDHTTGAFEGGSTEIAAAPVGALSGTASLKFSKGVSAQLWAGAVILDSRAGTARYTNDDFHSVTMNFYSPVTGTVPVMLQMQSGPDQNKLELSVDAVKGWQTLTFDFSSMDGWSADIDYKMLTIFPNFMQAGAADQVFYIDNFAVNGAVTPALPVALTSATAVKVKGTAAVGKKLTVTSGTWNGTKPLTKTYKWLACTKQGKTVASAKPADCTYISGATGASFTIKKAQVGKYIRVMETARNVLGSKIKVSVSTTKVK